MTLNAEQLNAHQAALAEFILKEGWQSVLASLQGMALAEAQCETGNHFAFEYIATSAQNLVTFLKERGVP